MHWGIDFMLKICINVTVSVQARSERVVDFDPGSNPNSSTLTIGFQAVTIHSGCCLVKYFRKDWIIDNKLQSAHTAAQGRNLSEERFRFSLIAQYVSLLFIACHMRFIRFAIIMAQRIRTFCTVLGPSETASPRPARNARHG